MRSLAVVGGGVIGFAIAWCASEHGWRVTLYDPDPGSGASYVAGGMLAPLSEGWPGEEQVLELGAASLQRWPDFAQRLHARSGIRVLAAEGTLTVALDGADAEDLRTVAEWVDGQGHELRLLTRAEVRDAEPRLSRAVRAGLSAPSELAVDNRALLAALRCAADDVELVASRVTDLDALDHDQIVLAAADESARLWPGLPVRPVKGEILRLHSRPGVAAGPRQVVRARIHGRAVYLVPRHDGMVVGATQYEHGRDTAVTVAGVRDLLADAEALFPALGEYEFAEAAAGLRPTTPDNLPLIGRVGERVVVATGHGRNGMLTTPVTVDAVLAALDGDQLVEAKNADPQRFSTERRLSGGAR